MKNDNKRALYDAVTGIDDDLVEEAAAPRVLPFPKHILRIAAIAAAVAILMTALLFLDGNNNHTPYFSVYVYANETEGVELTMDQDSAISNWDRTNDPTYRPIFDSHVGPGTPSNPYRDWFNIKIRLDDRTKNYENLTVFLDNKEIDQLSSGKVFVGYTSTLEGVQTGLSILGKVEKPAKIDLVLYNDSGDVLQSYTMIVSPLNEGYKIVLEEAYITTDGKNVFSRFG